MLSATTTNSSRMRGRDISIFMVRQRDFHSTTSRTALSSAVEKRATTMLERYNEIMDALSSGGATMNSDNKAELSSVARVSTIYTKHQSLQQEFQSLEELKQDALELDDKEMEDECAEEQEAILERIKTLEKRITSAVLPTDDEDMSADAILEIRAGAGGDEASLFAEEMLNAYERMARDAGYRFEYLSQTKTDLGGVREASLSIMGSGGGGSFASYDSGDGGDDEGDDDMASLSPYGYFKWESGVHRVQRVPVNDVKIQTSTASVAVLPAAADSKASTIPLSDLKIETMRSTGAGGQHVNTTESAIRITHIPTGITASIQDERSQHKNKAKALKLIDARVAAVLKEKEIAERGQARKSLMGGGDRSERIRTYNFPQDRITDHRVSHSVHGIAALLQSTGEESLVQTFAPLLRKRYKEDQLQELEEEQE
jgi:peptide chain release factor 1